MTKPSPTLLRLTSLERTTAAGFEAMGVRLDHMLETLGTIADELRAERVKRDELHALRARIEALEARTP